MHLEKAQAIDFWHCNASDVLLCSVQSMCEDNGDSMNLSSVRSEKLSARCRKEAPVKYD